MGLQVWLPLNGTLTNRGLTNSTVTNSGTTINATGKIGQCYSFASGNYIGIDSASVNNHKYSPITLTCWVYCTLQDSVERYILGCWELGGCGLCWLNLKVNFTVYAKSLYNTCWSNTVSLNTWHHIVGIFDNKVSKIYIDGQLLNTTVVNAKMTYNNTCPWEIGGNPEPGTYVSGNFIGKLNDVRIYDEALSPSQVKELSRGLMLHYPLRDRYIESTTNLTPIPSTYTTSTVAWDTGLNGTTAYAPTGWSNGYNGGVDVPTQGYHAHWVMDYGKNKLVMLFPNHNSIISKPRRWLGICKSFTMTGLTKNVQYTISYDLKCDKLGGYTTAGVYYKLNSSGSDSFHDGCPEIGRNTKVGVWEHFEYTFTRSSSYDGTQTSGSFYIYGHASATESNMWVDNVLLEIKTHSTPITSGSRSACVCSDCSGYNRAGTVTGSPQILPAGIHGKYCTFISNGQSQYITSPAISYCGDLITVNCWIKSTNTSPIGDYHMPIESYSPGYVEMSIHKNGYLRGGLHVNGIRYVANCTSTNLLNGLWHMITITYDGSIIKRYVDAVCESTTPITGTLNATSLQYVIGHYGNNTSYANNNMCENDVRIYSTALSQTDINELYLVAGKLDNNAFTPYEFIEE